MVVHTFAIGIVLGVLLTVGYFAARRLIIRRRMKTMFNSPQSLKKHNPKNATSVMPASAVRKATGRREKEGVVPDRKFLEEREAKMTEVLAEMRELVLRLTEIVASTDSASGEASERFEQAKKALENIEDEADVNLEEVKTILLDEIDRMVKTNEVLKKQLTRAQTGISSQKEEIDKLKAKAHFDVLTELANRAAFDERLQEVFFQWRHLRVAFALLMMDVDNFKQINDTHGHVHGDRILKEIAGKIKECIRDADFAARYGGEEFAIIFPDTPAEEALAVGTRIRENVERSHFQVDHNPLRITISGGISQSGMAFTPQDIVDVADKALYTSKKKGRNRITLSEDRIKESWTTGEGPITMPAAEGAQGAG